MPETPSTTAALPNPECECGYTRAQVEAIMGNRLDAFNRWMRGQTAAVCEGRRYDHDTREYVETGCGPHGMTVYPWDVQQFLQGGQPLD